MEVDRSFAEVPEVRRCAKCQQASVVLAQEWQHRAAGSNTGQVTRDYRCQSCGAKFRVRPRLYTTIHLCCSVLPALTIIGIPWLVVAWRRHTVLARIPVISGAPAPRMRFALGPPPRACGRCADTATVQSVKRTAMNGISMGTEFLYRCPKCDNQFTVHSPWAIVLGALLGLVCVAGVWAFLSFAGTPGWRYGGAGVVAAIVLLLFGQCYAQTQTRRRHRVVGAV